MAHARYRSDISQHHSALVTSWSDVRVVLHQDLYSLCVNDAEAEWTLQDSSPTVERTGRSQNLEISESRDSDALCNAHESSSTDAASRGLGNMST